MGRVFLAAGACFAAAFTFVSLCVSAPAADTPDCKLHRLAYLDITPDALNRPMVSVDINGTPKNFLVDTAGIYSGITNQNADALGLKVRALHASELTLAHGQIPVSVAIAKETKVGHLPLPNMSFLVMTAEGDDGILSSDVLHALDVEFDFAAAKLSLFLPAACPATIVHWTKEDHGEVDIDTARHVDTIWGEMKVNWQIFAPAKLDAMDIEVEIDTASPTSSLYLVDVEDMLPKGGDEALKRIDSEPTPKNAVYTYPFHTLTIGDVTVTNPDIKLMANKPAIIGRGKARKPRLILGMNVLNKLHLYISYKNEKIYLTPASAH